MHHVTSLDRGSDFLDVEEHPICTAASLGRIQPELYKQSTVEADSATHMLLGSNCVHTKSHLKSVISVL